MHDLQQLFAAAEREEAWEAQLRAHFDAGDLGAVAEILEPALAALDSDVGRLALDTRPEGVVLSGWEELAESIAMHEGEPVTGVTLAIANEADRVFEKGQVHHPYMMLGIYSDEPYRFSGAGAEELLAQCREEVPAWAGYDEDIEVYLDIEGLDQLNTTLLHHKQRHFFRDGDPEKAPLRYVEYVLGCWWRAMLFHQAVATESAIHGLPGGIPVITGMVEMRPEIVMIHGLGARSLAPEREAETASMIEVFAADFINRKPVEEIKELTGLDLRRRVVEAETDAEAETAGEVTVKEKSGLLARLFGRRAAR